MCEWQEDLRTVTISQTHVVDGCLADELELLNSYGVRTINSCCGHGTEEGYFNIHQNDSLSRGIAEGLGYEIRVKEDNGAVYLMQQGIEWGQLARTPPERRPKAPPA